MGKLRLPVCAQAVLHGACLALPVSKECAQSGVVSKRHCTLKPKLKVNCQHRMRDEQRLTSNLKVRSGQVRSGDSGRSGTTSY